MLVNADTGRVDHDDVAVVSLGNGFKKPVPDTCLPPADEAVVAGGRRPVALRDFRPGRARPKPPQDAVQDAPIIDTRNARGLLGSNGNRIDHSRSMSS
jgi:hypothetical protein